MLFKWCSWNRAVRFRPFNDEAPTVASLHPSVSCKPLRDEYMLFRRRTSFGMKESAPLRIPDPIRLTRRCPKLHYTHRPLPQTVLMARQHGLIRRPQGPREVTSSLLQASRTQNRWEGTPVVDMPDWYTRGVKIIELYTSGDARHLTVVRQRTSARMVVGNAPNSKAVVFPNPAKLPGWRCPPAGTAPRH